VFRCSRIFIRLVLAFSAGILGLSSPADCSITGVWAIGDGEKVYRYETNHPGKRGNSVWDGKTIRLKGLYNEVLAFQVIVEADSLGAEAVEVVVDPPAHVSTGSLIGASGGVKYGPRGTIEVFSEHYIHVRRPNTRCWFFGPASAPKKMTGWIPDALIPPDARPDRGGLPLDIPRTKQEVIRRHNTLEIKPAPERQNQGFWVDLYLPRDKDYPAGLYRGAVRVFERGVQKARLPLEVTLLPHYLPDENHSNVWLFGSNRVVNRYFPELSPEEVERMLKHAAHRHRIDLVGGSAVHRSPFDAELLAAYKPYLDGSAFTPAAGYHGPGEGCGEKLFPIGMYGSPVLGSAKEQVQKQADLWVEWFEKNAPGVRYFWYIIDEPGEVQFPWIAERACWVHDNPGPGSRLPVFTTRDYTEALAEHIDIWASNRGVNLEKLPGVKARGGDIWFYNGIRPLDGTVILEAAAVDFRMKAWVKYLYQLDTWFLWEGTHWQHNPQGPKAYLHQRIFSEPATFINWSLRYANGNGIVFYPGRMPFYPEEDRGLMRLLGSIRLKNIRRGQQDYEIMRLAEQKAGRRKVLEIVKSVVPRALKEVGWDEPLPWSERGDDYDRAREKLLELLE